MIPKIIHQTAPGESLTPLVRDNMARLRELNPGWDYRFHDDAAMGKIVREFGPAIFAAFNRINPAYGAARADLFRYLLVYRFGGVYLDIKSTTVRPLDEVILPHDEYLLCHWANRPGEAFAGWGVHKDLRGHPRGEFQQWHIIARAGHPFLGAVVREVLANIAAYEVATHGVGKTGVLRTTGPIAYTKAIVPLLSRGHHRVFESHAAMGLRYNIVMGEASHAHESLFKNHYSRLTEPVVFPQ